MDKKLRNISMRATCAEHDRWSQAAQDMRVTMSDIMRGALDDLAEQAASKRLGK